MTSCWLLDTRRVAGIACLFTRATAVVILGAMSLAVVASTASAQQRGGIDFFQEPACQTLTPTSMGGPPPKSPNLMVLRWLGAANHEVAYRDNVMLLDAYYERASPGRSLGFGRDDIKKATAVYVGHAHGDHMADAPYVAQRTGAPLIGAPVTIEQARKMGLTDKQVITVRGGEVQKYNGFTVEAVLAQHSARTPEWAKATDSAFRTLQEAAGLKTDDARVRQIRQGTGDPRVLAEGTMAFLFTFNNPRYQMIYLDSAGPVTEAEQKVMQRIGGRTDLAIVGYQGWVFPALQDAATLPLVKLFRPDVLLPTHHDDSGGNRPDMATYPFFMAVRDVLPDTRSISPLYKTPICVDLQTKEMYVGEPWAWAKRPPTATR